MRMLFLLSITRKLIAETVSIKEKKKWRIKLNSISSSVIYPPGSNFKWEYIGREWGTCLNPVIYVSPEEVNTIVPHKCLFVAAITFNVIDNLWGIILQTPQGSKCQGAAGACKYLISPLIHFVHRMVQSSGSMEFVLRMGVWFLFPFG